MSAHHHDAADTQYVITLIHGTWARKSTWIRSRSILWQALHSRFGKQVKICRTVWSGRNSPLARREAAARLRKKLALRLQNHDSARHYIICHSHGGDVALRALADESLRQRIDGVVCLATPFLIARDRDLGRDPIRYVSAALFALALLVAALTNLWLPHWRYGWLRLAVMVLLLAFVAGLAAMVFKRWRDYARSLQLDLAPPRVSPDRILIVQSPADEAWGSMAFAQFISQLTVLLFLRAQRLQDRFERAAERWADRRMRLLLAGAGAFAAIFVFLILYTLATNHGLAPWVRSLALVGAGGSGLVVTGAFVLLVPGLGADAVTIASRLAVSALLWPMAVLLSLLLVLPFGWQVAMANLLLHVTAEATPVSSAEEPWPVYMIEAATSRDLGEEASPLVHSRIYENPRVLKLMCDWIARHGAKPQA